MEQVRKALSRAKTAFGIIENSIGIIDNELGHVSPGREIYEIDLALKELEQSPKPCPVNAVVIGEGFEGDVSEIKMSVPDCEKCATLPLNSYSPQLEGNYVCSSCGYEFKIPSQ